ARFENTAVHAAGVQRRHFASCDRHHRFIEQCHTSRDFALSDQRTSLTLKCESNKIFVAETLATDSGLNELRMRCDCIAGLIQTVAFGQEQISFFYAVGL